MNNLYYISRIILIGLIISCSVWNASADNKQSNHEKIIEHLEKAIKAQRHQLEFLNFKKELHELCLCYGRVSRYNYNYKRGGVTCSGKGSFHRNWASGIFDGKSYKVSHQHPSGEKHDSGVTQAISVLQRKIDAVESSIAEKEQKLFDLQSNNNVEE